MASRERGFVLLIVLWTVALLALVSSHVTATARNALASAAALRTGAEAEAAADGLVREAMLRLLDPSAKHWSADGVPHQGRLPRGGSSVVTIVDEASRINPSTAPAEVMVGLLRAVGVDKGRAGGLASMIVDWHSLAGTAGQRLATYRGAGLQYIPPSAGFFSLDELALVVGMTPDVVARLAPYVTVHTAGPVNRLVADPLVLAVLRETLPAQEAEQTGPPVVRIIAQVKLPGGGATRQAVVRIDMGQDDPADICQILEWE